MYVLILEAKYGDNPLLLEKLQTQSIRIRHIPCTKKRSFPLRISLLNVTKSAVSCDQFPDLLIFTEEIVNRKLHFLCNTNSSNCFQYLNRSL